MTSDPDSSTPMLVPLPPIPTQKLKQYIATISVSLGAFCAGTVLAWSSPAFRHILIDNTTAIVNNQTLNVTIPPENSTDSSPGFKVTAQEEALIGAMLTIGALLFAIPTGFLADKIGRKATILGLSLPFLLNWILLIFSNNLEMVVAARFFAGMGLGGVCVVAPMYIGEIAEASHRGTLGSFFQMFLSCGILFTCVIGSVTNWVGLAAVLAISPILFGVSFIFMPETPAYLVDKDKLKKAEKTLKYFRGKFTDVSYELKEIQKEISESRRKTASLGDIVTNKANLRAVISVVGVLAFQQLSGINAVLFYTVTIFRAAGTGISSTLAAIIINLVQVIVSYISILVVEKANRKFFLMISSSGMSLCLAGLGMFFHLKILSIDVTNLGFIPLGSAIMFIISFSFGYGPVPWMLMSEVFAPEIKGIASGIAVLANWLSAFVVTYCFPIMNANLGGHITFYIFAFIMGCATVFVHVVVPETRGKTLNQIQEELNK